MGGIFSKSRVTKEKEKNPMLLDKLLLDIIFGLTSYNFPRATIMDISFA